MISEISSVLSRLQTNWQRAMRNLESASVNQDDMFYRQGSSHIAQAMRDAEILQGHLRELQARCEEKVTVTP